MPPLVLVPGDREVTDKSSRKGFRGLITVCASRNAPLRNSPVSVPMESGSA